MQTEFYKTLSIYLIFLWAFSFCSTLTYAAPAPKNKIIKKIIDGSLHKKIAEIDGLTQATAPLYGYSDPVIPDILYRVKLRFNIKSDLNTRQILRRITKFLVMKFFLS